MSSLTQLKNLQLAQPAIAVSELHRSFVSGKTVSPVLRGISLQIYPSELTMIIGPSGSGKSTLMATIGGLLKPDSGSVRVLQADLYALPASDIEAFRLEHCGFIFQGFNLFSSLTALEQVMLPLNYVPISASEAKSLASEVLAEVGLGNKMHLRPQELSGGEKQRVAVARALVKRPRLIFADEPTGALDSVNGDMVIELLHQAASKRGATVIAVTHDPRLMAHADRVIRIQDGLISSDERQTRPRLGDIDTARLQQGRRHANWSTREQTVMETGKVKDDAARTDVHVVTDLTAAPTDGDINIPPPVAPGNKGKYLLLMFICLLLAAGGAYYYFKLPPLPDTTATGGDGHSFVSNYAAIGKGVIDVQGGIVSLAASRDGIIREVYFEEGQAVKGGEILAIQDNGEATISMRVAEAELSELKAGRASLYLQLKAARRNLDRLRALSKSKNISIMELDESEDRVLLLKAQLGEREAALHTARARVEAAAEEIELRTIRAPVDGQIVRRLTRPGDGASTLSVTPLFLFAPDQPTIVRAEFGEKSIGNIKVGMVADIVPVVDERISYPATIHRIGKIFAARRVGVYDPRESAVTQVVEVVLLLDDQDANVLLGQRVIVKVNKQEQAAIGGPPSPPAG